MPTTGTRPPPNDVTALSRDREPQAAEMNPDESSLCRYAFVSSSSLRTGRVYSPRYPRNFAPDVDCVYRFQGAGRTRAGTQSGRTGGAGGDKDERVVFSLLSVQLGQPPGVRHRSTTTHR